MVHNPRTGRTISHLRIYRTIITLSGTLPVWHSRKENSEPACAGYCSQSQFPIPNQKWEVGTTKILHTKVGMVPVAPHLELPDYTRISLFAQCNSSTVCLGKQSVIWREGKRNGSYKMRGKKLQQILLVSCYLSCWMLQRKLPMQGYEVKR